jgi:hypothetical protein
VVKIHTTCVATEHCDEFELELPDETFNTPAAPDTTLQHTGGESALPAEDQAKYRSGVGKLLHMMRWSRPDILNATREVSRFLGVANPAHMKALNRILKYCADTPDRGLMLNPKGKWDGKDKNFLFDIRGKQMPSMQRTRLRERVWVVMWFI